MLFKTIYGPELESVFKFIARYGPIKKEPLYRSFIPLFHDEQGSKTNLDDAIKFLISSGLVQKDDPGTLQAVNRGENFKLLLLANLRRLQKGEMVPFHITDTWYMDLLERLFIKPNQNVLFNLHQHFNNCGVQEIISEEKVNAWRRFMEFMGVGHRVFGGFYSLYSPQLLKELLKRWPEEEGPIQLFFEEYIGSYIPWQASEGDAASAIICGLTYLEKNNVITLTTRQDLPYRSYFGYRKVKWIRKDESN